MNRRSIPLAFVTIVLCLVPLLGAPRASADTDEITVIVNRSNPVPAMNRSQLNAVFRVKSTQFPGGGRAAPVNLAPEHDVRQRFDLAVLGMRRDEVERFWLDSKIRSGVGSPRKLSGPDAVVRYVASDEAGIGYVPTSDANASVRVVARIRGGEVLPP